MTSNIKIKAILPAAIVWSSLVKSYPLVTLSCPTRVACLLCQPVMASLY